MPDEALRQTAHIRQSITVRWQFSVSVGATVGDDRAAAIRDEQLRLAHRGIGGVLRENRIERRTRRLNAKSGAAISASDAACSSGTIIESR
jgi:hypothetical protein